VNPGDVLGRPRVPGVGLADGISRAKLVSVEVVVVLNSDCCPIKGLSRPLAVAVEPVSVAISKAETLSRPVSRRDGVSRVDGHSAVEGLSAPLAVVATVVEAGVKTGDLLVATCVPGVGLAQGVLGGVLVPVDVVAVLKSGNGTVVSIGIGISTPLAVAGVELSPLLVRTSSTRMRLADRVARGQLMSVHVVEVLKSGGEGDSVSVRS